MQKIHSTKLLIVREHIGKLLFRFIQIVRTGNGEDLNQYISTGITALNLFPLIKYLLTDFNNLYKDTEPEGLSVGTGN